MQGREGGEGEGRRMYRGVSEREEAGPRALKSIYRRHRRVSEAGGGNMGTRQRRIAEGRRHRKGGMGDSRGEQ